MNKLAYLEGYLTKRASKTSEVVDTGKNLLDKVKALYTARQYRLGSKQAKRTYKKYVEELIEGAGRNVSARDATNVEVRFAKGMRRAGRNVRNGALKTGAAYALPTAVVGGGALYAAS